MENKKIKKKNYWNIVLDIFNIFGISTLAGFGFYFLNFIILKNIFLSILMGCLISSITSCYILLFYLLALKRKRRLKHGRNNN